MERVEMGEMLFPAASPRSASTGHVYAPIEQPRKGQCVFCMDVWDEFRVEKLSLSIMPYEREWRKQYGESIVTAGPVGNLVLKISYSAVMLFAQYLSTWNWGAKIKFYAIYLTYWTLTIQNAYHLANVGMAVQALRSDEPLRGSVELSTALRAIAQPCALIVALLYTLGTGFVDHSLPNVMVHGVNAAVIVSDGITGKQMSRLANSYLAFAYMSTYAAWTFLHSKMAIGNANGHSWIYRSFDWHEPAKVWWNIGVLFVFVLPAAAFLMWSLVYVRDTLMGDTDRLRARRWWHNVFDFFRR